MFLKKSFKRDFVLLLAKGLDFWESTMTYSAQRYFLYFGRWRKSAIYSQVSKLLKVGDIEKVTKNGQVFIRLTSQGSQKLKQDIPILALSEKSWDRKWRLVAFDIPEKQRIKRITLRNKLLSLSFGQWQKSVYISPYNFSQEINQFLKHKKLFNFAVCFEAKRLSEVDDRLLARKAWKLDKLAEKYEEFIDKCSELEDEIKEKTYKKKTLTEITEQFLELLEEDPCLPYELLPIHWPVPEAKKSFHRLLNLVP